MYLTCSCVTDIGYLLHCFFVFYVFCVTSHYSACLYIIDIKKKEADAKTTVTKEASDPKTMARMKVDPPPLEAMLRYPIEVFVSCGEAFVKPQSKTISVVCALRYSLRISLHHCTSIWSDR